MLRAQGGQREASNELARRHRKTAYLYALHLLGNPDDALDVAQEVMLQFFTHLSRFDADRPLRPWLMAIVRNKVRDLWRRRRVRPQQPFSELDAEFTPLMTDPAPSPEENSLRNELQRRLWSALSSLPEEKREILILREYHDLKYAEIAQVLDIPHGTVMSRLHSARRALREEILKLQAAEAAGRTS